MLPHSSSASPPTNWEERGSVCQVSVKRVIFGYLTNGAQIMACEPQEGPWGHHLIHSGSSICKRETQKEKSLPVLFVYFALYPRLKAAKVRTVSCTFLYLWYLRCRKCSFKYLSTKWKCLWIPQVVVAELGSEFSKPIFLLSVLFLITPHRSEHKKNRIKTLPTRGWGKDRTRNRPVSMSWTNSVGITKFGQWPC